MNRLFLESLPVRLLFDPEKFGRTVVVGISPSDIEEMLKKKKYTFLYLLLLLLLLF